MFLADSLGFQLSCAARAVARQLGAALTPWNLTTSQWAVLQYVTEHPGRHQEHISAALGTDAATLAQVLRRLERDGRIRRQRDPDDHRRFLVNPADRSGAGAGQHLAAAVNTQALAGFSDDERAALLVYLRRIQTNIAGCAPPVAPLSAEGPQPEKGPS